MSDSELPIRTADETHHVAALAPASGERIGPRGPTIEPQSWHWQRPDPLGSLYQWFPLKLLMHDQVGLDLGSHWIKYTVTRHGPGSERILAAGGVPIQARGRGEMGKIRAQVGALLAIREKIERKAQRWVVGISGPGTMVRTVEVPHMPRRELHKAVLWQAQKKMPFPLDEAHVAVRILKSRPNQPVQAVVAAAIKRMVDDLLYLLAEAEIHPDAVTLPAFGLGALLQHAGFRRAGEYYGLLDIGAERSLFAVYHGSTMEFFREIDLGISDVEEALAGDTEVNRRLKDAPADGIGAVLFGHGLNTDEAATAMGKPVSEAVNAALEKLLLEIQSTLEYYAAQSGGLRLNTFLLLGGGAEIPGIDRHLNNFLEIPVQLLDPLVKGVDVQQIEHGTLSAPSNWANALGYSLLPRRIPNLLPPEYLKERDAQFRQMLWRSATGTAVAASLVLAGTEYYRGSYAADRLAAMQAQLAETNSKLESFGVHNLEAKLTANRRWLAAVSRQDLNSATILRSVAAAIPEAIAVDRLDIQPHDSGWAAVALSGEVRTDHEQNEVTLVRLVKLLEATGRVSHMSLDNYVTRRKPEYEQINFTLSFRVPLEVAHP
jgi:type IV pilus assembly protein PilM